jgi:hypothetical protein
VTVAKGKQNWPAAPSRNLNAGLTYQFCTAREIELQFTTDRGSKPGRLRRVTTRPAAASSMSAALAVATRRNSSHEFDSAA